MVPRVNAPNEGVARGFSMSVEDHDGGNMSTIEEQLKALREETLAALKQISAEMKRDARTTGLCSWKKRILTESLKG